MFNKAILIGRLTADPELKQTQSGISVCSFSIAVDRRFSGRDSERKTDFINITSWRQQAEFVCRYFHKGDVIGVEGSIQTRNYEDKNGNKRTATLKNRLWTPAATAPRWRRRCWRNTLTEANKKQGFAPHPQGKGCAGSVPFMGKFYSTTKEGIFLWQNLFL